MFNYPVMPQFLVSLVMLQSTQQIHNLPNMLAPLASTTDLTGLLVTCGIATSAPLTQLPTLLVAALLPQPKTRVNSLSSLPLLAIWFNSSQQPPTIPLNTHLSYMTATLKRPMLPRPPQTLALTPTAQLPAALILWMFNLLQMVPALISPKL